MRKVVEEVFETHPAHTQFLKEFVKGCDVVDHLN